MNPVNPVGPDRRAGRMEISHEATKGANPAGPDRRAGRMEISHEATKGVNPVGPDRRAGRMEISHEATKGANPAGPDRRAGRMAIGPYRMGVGPSTLLRGTAAAVLGMALCVLLSAGCSGGREDGDAAATRRDTASPPSAAETADARERIPPQTPMRREFVILRELVKQHAKQTEAGNAERLAIVDRNLRERLAALPDEGQTEDEREVVRKARGLGQ